VGISDDLGRRLRFLDLTSDEIELLRGLRPALELNAERIVNVFYRHLLSFSEMRPLLSEPDVKTRLLDMQKAYLLSLAPPALGSAYVEERLRIGQTHYRVGLEPRWYLGAYSLYFRLILPLVAEAFSGQPMQIERVAGALNKVLMLDAQLAMEAYIGRREEQLEYLNLELSRAGQDLERVYEAQSMELRQTTARAAAAEDLASIATVVAGLAHEIGTPMSVIQGHTELLESSVSDDSGRWILKTIREQIDRISHIIQTLLSMARPGERALGKLNLCSTLEQSLEFLGEKLRLSGVVPELELRDHVEMEGNRDKLQQLFINLILNAVDAMPSGGKLTVQVKRRSELAEVRIADTGEGIPEDQLQRIFDPFFTTKEAGRGNGLGLMVSKGIVRDHGGSIRVGSKLGKGTEFTIQFPLSLSEESAEDPAP